jgi:uncharacterized protein (DUF2141 family)
MVPLRRIGLAFALTALAIPASAGELKVTIEGLRSPQGTILIGLYDSAASFDRAIQLSDKAGFLNDGERVAGAALRAGPALRCGIVFANLPPGRYAIILFHDEDGDGRLSKNFFGVPTEPYGFSNDAQGFLGPPSFAQAAMTLDGGNAATTIKVVYHGGGLVDAPGGALADQHAAPLKRF